MKPKDIVTAKNKVEDVFHLLNYLISFNGLDMLDLAFPEHDGKPDDEVVAEMMLLRQSTNSLSDACKILVRRLTSVIEIADKNENK